MWQRKKVQEMSRRRKVSTNVPNKKPGEYAGFSFAMDSELLSEEAETLLAFLLIWQTASRPSHLANLDGDG